MKPTKILFFFYNRFADPLLQSNIFQYINKITDDQNHSYEFVIITFEDKKIPLTNAQIVNIENELKKRKITWRRFNWHEGDGILLKALDLISAFFAVLKFRLSGFKNIITLGSIAGSFIYLISRFIPLKYYLYQYEPHSEYGLDGNLWTRDSLQFKLLNFFERLSLKKASVISSGTDNMKQRLLNEGIHKPFFKLTSVVNDQLFNFSEKKRQSIRQDLGISDNQKLIIYPGKLGGLYASAERMANLLGALADLDPTYRFLIITNQKAEINKALNSELELKVKIIPAVPFDQMPGYLSAGDLGIVSVLPGESQKFRSNIKVGEFLCTGLPYLICKGISEDDIVAKEYNVGIVLNDLTNEEIQKHEKSIYNIISESKVEIVKRCRPAGISYRGFKIQYEQFISAISELTKA